MLGANADTDKGDEYGNPTVCLSSVTCALSASSADPCTADTDAGDNVREAVGEQSAIMGHLCSMLLIASVSSPLVGALTRAALCESVMTVLSTIQFLTLAADSPSDSYG